jgi:hypothetical protein
VSPLGTVSLLPSFFFSPSPSPVSLVPTFSSLPATSHTVSPLVANPPRSRADPSTPARVCLPTRAVCVAALLCGPGSVSKMSGAPCTHSTYCPATHQVPSCPHLSPSSLLIQKLALRCPTPNISAALRPLDIALLPHTFPAAEPH